MRKERGVLRRFQEYIQSTIEIASIGPIEYRNRLVKHRTEFFPLTEKPKTLTHLTFASGASRMQMVVEEHMEDKTPMPKGAWNNPELPNAA